MLIDLHAHTSGISKCCKISAEENIKLAKKLGFDGLAVTNHYTSLYFDGKTYDEWIERYIDEWHKCIMFADKFKLRIFCGIEVTMNEDMRLHMLIYGAAADFLRKNQRLCDMSLEKLYNVCRKNDCALVQAHPFRNGTVVQNTDCLDGIEINCHPLYKNSYHQEIAEIAQKSGLAVTAGCDYHADSYRPLGGSMIPDTVKTDRDLAEYIIHSKEFSLKIHDPVSRKIFETDYKMENNICK